MQPKQKSKHPTWVQSVLGSRGKIQFGPLFWPLFASYFLVARQKRPFHFPLDV